ncbi:MAG: hypothetical protein ACREX3_18705 [Gammaproteobacteria bacterium]
MTPPFVFREEHESGDGGCQPTDRPEDYVGAEGLRAAHAAAGAVERLLRGLFGPLGRVQIAAEIDQDPHDGLTGGGAPHDVGPGIRQEEELSLVDLQDLIDGSFPRISAPGPRRLEHRQEHIEVEEDRGRRIRRAPSPGRAGPERRQQVHEGLSLLRVGQRRIVVDPGKLVEVPFPLSTRGAARRRQQPHHRGPGEPALAITHLARTEAVQVLHERIVASLLRHRLRPLRSPGRIAGQAARGAAVRELPRPANVILPRQRRAERARRKIPGVLQ